MEQKGNLKSRDKIEIMKKMVELVWKLRDVLYSENLDKIGEILHQNWLLKKQMAAKISNREMDNIYDIALKNGAIGGKLLGAGAGGFFLFYCDKKNQRKLRDALSFLKEMPFKFETEGSKLIHVGDEYYEP